MVFIFWNSRSLRMYTTVPALACVSVQSLVWILDNDCAKKALKSGSARVNGHRHGKGRGWKRVWMVIYANKPRQSLDIPLYGYESAEGEDEGETHTGNRERTRLDGGGCREGCGDPLYLIPTSWIVRGNHYYQCPHFRGVEIDILG